MNKEEQDEIEWNFRKYFLSLEHILSNEGIFDITREYFTKIINLDFDKKENFSSQFRWDIKVK